MSVSYNDTTPIGNYILLWLQRKTGKDAILKIWCDDDRYFTKFIDPVLAAGKHASFIFDDVYGLREYLELFFENMTHDDEDKEPFLYIQWDIPGFTSSLIKLENMEDSSVYSTFTRCIEFYFDNK